MSTQLKNLMVGIFVLIGLIILAVLIILFGELLQFMRPGYVVTVHLENASRISAGKIVHKNGLIIGEVMRVEPAPPASPGVLVKFRVSRAVDIPNDAPLVASKTSLGEVFLDIPVTAANKGKPIPKDGTATLAGRVEPFSFLPKKAMKPLEDLGKLIRNFIDLTEPRTPAQVRQSQGKLRPNVSTVVHGLDAIINDPENQQNLKEGLAKIRTAADELAKTL